MALLAAVWVGAISFAASAMAVYVVLAWVWRSCYCLGLVLVDEVGVLMGWDVGIGIGGISADVKLKVAGNRHWGKLSSVTIQGEEEAAVPAASLFQSVDHAADQYLSLAEYIGWVERKKGEAVVKNATMLDMWIKKFERYVPLLKPVFLGLAYGLRGQKGVR